MESIIKELWRRKMGMLFGARSVLIVPLGYEFQLKAPRDADTEGNLCLEVCSAAACESPFCECKTRRGALESSQNGRGVCCSG